MKQYGAWLLVLLTIAGVVSCVDDGEFAEPAGNEDEVVELSERNAAFADFLTSSVESNGVAGLAAAVVSSDDFLFMDGIGMRDIAASKPVTADTLFHIGSTQKSMTALMIATLVDEGLFDWDTPVVAIYPQFELADANATQAVTVRHLLSMRSGIPDMAEETFDMEASADSVIPFVASAELLGPPGNHFSYSNIASSVAGYLGVIAATGSDSDLYDGYVQLLTERVLRPSGMEAAVMRVSDARRDPNYGKSYELANGRPVEEASWDFEGDPLAPSGTVKASVREMAGYVQMQLNEGIAPNGVRVASAENLTETWKPYLEGYGMGWETERIDGVTVLSHQGSFDNYLSVIGFMPNENIGFVVLTNSAEAAEQLIAETAATVVELYTE